MPKERIETARYIAEHDPIHVYAPDDPNELKRKVNASQGLRLKLFLGSGRPPDASDLLSLHALGETIRGGAKIIRPSTEVCRFVSNIGLNIHLSE